MTSLFAELRRRHVYRVAVVYIVMSWLLLQVGDIVLGTFETPSWVMKALLALLVLGFPLAVALAWAFELTPEGVRRTEPLDSPEARAPEDRRRVGHGLNITLGAALVMALAFIGWQHLSRPAADDTTRDTQAMADAGTPMANDERKSIAVLPLANGSGDPAQEYFSDGLSDELISGLSKIPGLKVIGRSSSFQFKTSNEPGTAIGQKLGVDHLLEGSVRQQGERVRIMVSLVRAEDGSTLWTQSFDRTLEDIFAVQREIAQAVAASLRIELTPSVAAGLGHDQPPSGDPRVYQSFLRGRAHGTRSDAASYRMSIEHHREAIRLDPDYTAPYLGMAISMANLSQEVPLAEAEQLRRQAHEATARVLQLAPGSINAHYAAGIMLFLFDRDMAGAEREFRLALEMTPNHAGLLTNIGTIVATQGRFEEAVALLRQSFDVDPLNTLPRYQLIWPLLALGELDAAEREARAVIEMEPGFPFIHGTLGDIYALRGDVDALRKLARDSPSDDSRRYMVGLEAALSGDVDGLAKASDELISRCQLEEYSCVLAAAALHAFADQSDSFFALLDRLSAEPRYSPSLADPFTIKYWHDPRFIAHLEQYGMSLPSPVSQPARKR